MTVGQLQAQLDQIQTVLSTAAATAAELQDWSKGLPRRYVPPTDEVLVTDMTRVASSDPGALQRRAGEVEDLALQVAAAMTQLRATAAADTGHLGRSLRQDPAPVWSGEAGMAGSPLELDEHDRSLSGAWHLQPEGESWVLANQSPAAGYYRIQLGSIRTAAPPPPRPPGTSGEVWAQGCVGGRDTVQGLRAPGSGQDAGVNRSATLSGALLYVA